jgi:hypothetical protein
VSTYRRALQGGVPGLAIVLAAAAAELKDKITLTAVSPGDEPVLLVRGRRDDGCDAEKMAIKDIAPVELSNLLSPRSPDESCISEIALLSRNHAALVWKNPGFTQSADDITVPNPGARRDVPLNVVAIHSNQKVALDRAGEALLEATTRFDLNRVGLRFVPPSTIPWFDPADPAVAGIGRGCESLDGVRASSLYDPARLNVYFVPTIDTPSASQPYGYDCFEYGGPEVIYISLQFSIPTVLSHEIGHALSLRGVHGHVEGRPGFDEENLMWKGLDPNETRDQKTFTLGQAYRMNVDSYSWLNLKVGPGNTGAAVRRGETKGCQDILTKALPCLRLREAWPE